MIRFCILYAWRLSLWQSFYSFSCSVPFLITFNMSTFFTLDRQFNYLYTRSLVFKFSNHFLACLIKMWKTILSEILSINSGRRRMSDFKCESWIMIISHYFEMKCAPNNLILHVYTDRQICDHYSESCKNPLVW